MRSSHAGRDRLLRIPGLALALLVGAAIVGCGEERVSVPVEVATLEPVGEADFAVADRVRTIDPLFVDSRAERMVARQIFEPLVSRQKGPFGETRVRDGIARSIGPTGDGRTWVARLRPGVRFTNGSPVDAEAVTLNAVRWIADPAGQRRLPALTAAFSPRPGLVRFVLSEPDPRFAERLGDGRFGLVAPAALERADGEPVGFGAAGAGPFELRLAERERDRVLLARNLDWWGTPVGLGPGVDTLEFETVPLSAARADRLLEGQVVVADQLDSLGLVEVAAEPLTVTVGTARDRSAAMGLERSVRGITETSADQSLADVWLTTLR